MFWHKRRVGDRRFSISAREFPLPCLKRPGSPEKIPGFDLTGNFDQAIGT
jgi:hypothetical protein